MNRFAIKLILTAAASALLAAFSPAQIPEQPTPLPSSPETPAPPQLPPTPLHRLRYMITDGDSDSQYRLTANQKFLLALHHSVSLEGHGGNIFLSAIQQAADTQPHYKQGWDGYGQRILASEAYKASSSLVTIGALSSLMKTDPRFIRLGRGTFRERIWYATRRTVITRRDSGGSTFNLPFVFGQLAAGSVAVAYYPDRDRTAGSVFESWGLHLLYNSGFNCLREFSPLILRIVIPRRTRKANSTPAESPSSLSGRPLNP
ncbi:MAG: hypothetical protein LAN71_12825 [Acidobacteriia bacterium]|nr:hypothetical protein [Terriglobia bacterium]